MVVILRSALFNEIRAALRAMDAHSAAPPWNADLLAAAGALVNVVLPALPEAELPFFKRLSHPEGHPQERLVLLIALADIPGKHPEIKKHDARQLQQLQRPHSDEQIDQNHRQHSVEQKLVQLVHTVAPNHKPLQLLSEFSHQKSPLSRGVRRILYPGRAGKSMETGKILALFKNCRNRPDLSSCGCRLPPA